MPLITDIFRDDAFSAVELTRQINKEPFMPTLAGEQVFRAVPVSTIDVALEVEKGKFCILDVRPRGAPPPENTLVQPEFYSVRTRMINDSITIQAEQLQGITAMPYDLRFQTVQNLVARGQAMMRRNMAMTFRQSYLNCLQGKWVNNGNTIIDWYAYWGQSQAAEIDFALTTDATDVISKCEQVREQMVLASDGMLPEDVEIHALSGANFLAALRNHPKVRDTYMGYQAAASLREGNAFKPFDYGDIFWNRTFRGTADGTTMAIPADKVYFYPVGTDIFPVFYGPHDSFETINTPGVPLYVVQIMDRERDQWVRYENWTYPLIACLQPACLQRGKKA